MNRKRKIIFAVLIIALLCCVFIAGALYGAHYVHPRVRAIRYLSRPEFADLPHTAREVVFDTKSPATAQWLCDLFPFQWFPDVDIIISFRATPKIVDRFIADSPCLKDVTPSVNNVGQQVYEVQRTAGPGSGWIVKVGPERKTVRIHFWSEFT